jgi:hypothetical protein
VTTYPAFLAFLFYLATHHGHLWSPWSHGATNDPWRAVLVMPLLRVLLLSAGLRQTTLGLVAVIYRVAEQIGGCAIVSYFFAVLGVRLFQVHRGVRYDVYSYHCYHHINLYHVMYYVIIIRLRHRQLLLRRARRAPLPGT